MLKSGLHANNDILGADSGDCLRFLESLKVCFCVPRWVLLMLS